MAILLLRVSFVLLIAAGVVSAHCKCKCKCKPFWTPFQGNCYRLFAPKTWSKAESHCRSFQTRRNHGHLASIHNAEEDGFLQAMMETTVTSDNVWIGASDSAKEGTFVWRDDTPFDYRNWHPKEPNNHKRNQDCVTLWRRKGRLAWDDKQCDRRYPYICKIASGR